LLDFGGYSFSRRIFGYKISAANAARRKLFGGFSAGKYSAADSARGGG
jgi:hypothetical protein